MTSSSPTIPVWCLRPPLGSCGWLTFTAVLVVLAIPFAAVVDTFFICDDIQMRYFGATVQPSEFSWLPSSQWSWHRPLPAYTWVVTYRFFGSEVVWWHLPNVVLHVINVVLAARLSERLSGSRWVAILTAVFFAWSPASAGTVNWISARPDLMATTCSLATLSTASSPWLLRRPSLQTLVVAMWVVAAISSKESAFALLPIALFLAIIPRLSDRFPKAWQLEPRLAATIVIILLGFLAARLVLYGPTLGGYGVPLSMTRLLTAPVLAQASLVAAVGLFADSFGGLHAITLLLLGAAVLLAGLRFAPLWTVAALLAVLPAAHLISASSPIWEFDRFYYFASFWFAGGLATLIVDMAEKRSLALACSLAMVVLVSDGAYQVQRILGLRSAARVSESVDGVLRAVRHSLPSGSVIWCGELPDNLGGFFLYRNGCEEHVRWYWPGGEVVGVRKGERPRGPSVYALVPDGTALLHVRDTPATR